MTAAESAGWPVVDLDPVRRLRVLAESTPGTVYTERTVPADFDRTWAIAADLETSMPAMIDDIRGFTIIARHGTQLEALARSPWGMRARFDIVLRPGYCVMRSRFVVGGMAAVPVGEHTHFAFFGGLRFAGIRFLTRPLRPLTARVGQRAIARFTVAVTG